MLASVIISNKLSLVGAKGAQKLAGKASFGLMGAVGRNTVGRGFSKILQSKRLKDWSAGEGKDKAGNKVTYGKVTRNLAGFALKTSATGSKSSFDIRGASGVAAGAKGLGLDLGKPQKGGYETVLKTQVKKRDEFKKLLGTDTTELESQKISFEGEKVTIEEQTNRKKELFKKEKKAAELALETEKMRYETAKKIRGENSSEALGSERNVKNIEKTIGQLEADMSTNVSLGDAKIKAVETKISGVTKEIGVARETGKQRVAAYAHTLSTEKTLDTLYRKVPRKNKIAAVKVRSEESVEEKLINKFKKGLKKEIKEEGDKKEKEESEDSSGSKEEKEK